MADITKCVGVKGKGIQCPIRKDCYRYMARPSEYQSYFKNMPFDFKKKKCEEFWKVKK